MFKTINLSILISLTLTILIGCKSNRSESPFSTKEDSIQFAKVVLEQYPQTQRIVSSLPTQDTGIKIYSSKGVHPIPWDTVLSYQKYYDQAPKIFNLNKEAYRGFSIDPAGYQLMLKNETIKGLFLRLGRKGNGEYTIMVLGTDMDGNILNHGVSGNLAAPEDSTNFDNTTPCPETCPAIEN